DFNLSHPATITLQSSLFVEGKSITINGPGASNLFISGDNSVPVFVFHGGGTISGVTIQYGNSLLGGCVVNRASAPTLIDTRVANCTGLFGGGILNIGTLNVINSTIANSIVGVGNQPGVGGGILNLGGTVSLNGSTVSGNIAVFSPCYQAPPGDGYRGGCGGGGGIYNTAGGMITATNSKLSENSSIDGGGLLNYNGTATLTDSTLMNNTAFSNGGGIENASSGVLTVTNSTISGNLAYGQGFPYTVLDVTVTPGGGG